MINKIFLSSLIVSILGTFAANAKPASDYVNMQKARKYFSQGKLKSAVKIYAKIPKSSEYWMEALEEQAHTYGRQGKYHKTMANLKTVLADQFTGLRGPEPYFVMALTQLKICDYTGVLKNN